MHSFGINDPTLVRTLDALRRTVPFDKMYVLTDAVHRFADIETFFTTINLRNWGWYFQPKFVDPDDICSKVFCVFAGIVRYEEPTPTCPQCGASTAFEQDMSKAFGWRYRCQRSSRLVSGETGQVRRCRGSVLPTANTWIDNSHAIDVAVFLTFMWTCRVCVVQAARHADTSDHTAVDYYSMCREVCEVVMSNDLLELPLGGPGKSMTENHRYI